MKMYCPECGSPTEYSSKKPNFCTNCGYNFITNASASPPSQKEAQSMSSKPDDPDSEEYDIKEIDPRIYQMQGLDVEVQKTEAKSLTFGDMFPKLDEEKTGKNKKKN